MHNKRGVSELISTVLIILITISAGTLLYVVVKPLILGTMEESTKCNNAELTIVPEILTCYNSSSNEVYVEISRGAKAEMQGISIQIIGDISGGGLIRNNTASSGIREYNQTSGPLMLPGKDESRTYVFNLATFGITNPQRVLATPLVQVQGKDKLCMSSQRVEILEC